MTEPGNPAIPWRHEIPVAWDNDFVPFPYRDGAGRITVMRFDPSWAKNAADLTKGTEGTGSREAELLNEQAYMRETQSSKKNVLRLHAALSNRFRSWIERRFGVLAVQEDLGVDLHFTHEGVSHLAELKICYGENTRLAIREALGQVFEYNHYPPRLETQKWWIVLDCRPCGTDVEYVALLTKRYHLPLRLAWQDERISRRPLGLLYPRNRNYKVPILRPWMARPGVLSALEPYIGLLEPLWRITSMCAQALLCFDIENGEKARRRSGQGGQGPQCRSMGHPAGLRGLEIGHRF